MAIIVETGSIVAGANSYVSDAEYTTYATSRGDTIGATVEAGEVELLNAMDYLEYYSDEYKGLKVTRDQLRVQLKYLFTLILLDVTTRTHKAR